MTSSGTCSNQTAVISYRALPNAHCRAIFMSDLDSWDSVDAKNGLTHLDWTPDTRDTECVLKWVLARIAAFCCARRPQIWIPETEYYQKVSSHAQIGPQGAEKQLRKVVVGGGGWVVVVGVWPKTRTAPAQKQIRSQELVNYSVLFLVYYMRDDINTKIQSFKYIWRQDRRYLWSNQRD